MAKPNAAAATKAATPEGAVDISKLTPAQLAEIQKQLRAKQKAASGKSEDRFKIIDKMLQEKDGDAFANSTADIFEALLAAKLVDTSLPDHRTREIKKIQARKQFLEKKRDEKGNLVHPEGSFGYKVSAHGFILTGERIVEWFKNEENLDTITDSQRTQLLNILRK